MPQNNTYSIGTEGYVDLAGHRYQQWYRQSFRLSSPWPPAEGEKWLPSI
jgi:hypothetical protein